MNIEDETDELQSSIRGVDWANDALFFTHRWRDETSQFDDHPSVRWQGGGEYYDREYAARVPVALKDCDQLVELFVTMMSENYPEAKGFWVS